MGATPVGDALWVISRTSGIQELETVARSLNALDSEVIYSTDTVTVLDNVLYIYDPSNQTTWGKPAGIPDGQKISVVDTQGVLTTTDLNTYTLIRSATENQYDLTQWGFVSGSVGSSEFATAMTYLNGLYLLDGIPRRLTLTGELKTASALRILDGVYFVNNGLIKFTGLEDVGTLVLIRSALDCGITSDAMGVIDGGDIGNVNGIGVSGQTGAGLGGESRRIIANNQTIKNCRSNHTFPSEIGNKGGKGISFQTGPRSVLVDNIYVEDCDIGYGFEASINNDGKCEVQMSNVRARNCTWIGGLYWGTFSDETNTGDYFDITHTNVTLEDCGMPVSTTDGFAPIVFNCRLSSEG